MPNVGRDPCLPLTNVQSNARLAMRSGARSAISCAMRPPIECPTRWNASIFSASMIASASEAIASMLSTPGPGADRPMPRLSKATRSNRAPSPSICGRQPSPTTPTPWMSNTDGPTPLRR